MGAASSAERIGFETGAMPSWLRHDGGIRTVCDRGGDRRGDGSDFTRRRQRDVGGGSSGRKVDGMIAFPVGMEVMVATNLPTREPLAIAKTNRDTLQRECEGKRIAERVAKCLTPFSAACQS
jgi:hypothetical protein